MTNPELLVKQWWIEALSWLPALHHTFADREHQSEYVWTCARLCAHAVVLNAAACQCCAFLQWSYVFHRVACNTLLVWQVASKRARWHLTST